jgi:hypothetical protein
MGSLTVVGGSVGVVGDRFDRLGVGELADAELHVDHGGPDRGFQFVADRLRVGPASEVIDGSVDRLLEEREKGGDVSRGGVPSAACWQATEVTRLARSASIERSRTFARFRACLTRRLSAVAVG